MGLGKVQEGGKNTYLSIAGGYIWDRKAEESNPNYATQEFDRADGTKGERKGAKYADLTGDVTGVEMRTHQQYGESINVKVTSEGENYIMSIGTNNQYSQSMMKALLIMDFNEPLYIRPYDFTDTKGKRSQGISFRQDGEKMDLRSLKLPNEFNKESDFWKTAGTKKIKRFFEDLSDYFVGEIEAKVIPQLDAMPKTEKAEAPKTEAPKVEPQKTEKAEAPKAEAKVEAPKVEQDQKGAIEAEARPSVIKMRRFVKEYITENYPDQTLPKLSREEVATWYDLALAEEELPFGENNKVGDDELKDELKALLGKK